MLRENYQIIVLAGDLLLSCYTESSPGFVLHIKTAAGRYCSGEGVGVAAGGVPTVPIALSGGRRDEGHTRSGICCPSDQLFLPKFNPSVPSMGLLPQAGILEGGMGTGSILSLSPWILPLIPVGPASVPVGPVTIPMGSVTIPLSPAIIPVGCAGFLVAPPTIPVGLIGVPRGPAIIPMGPVTIPMGPAIVPMGPASSPCVILVFPWVVPVSPCPSRVVPLFMHLLPQDASVGLWVLLINTNFWRGCGVCGKLQLGGAREGWLHAEVRTWAHAFFIGCTRGYFYFFLFPSSSPRCKSPC